MNIITNPAPDAEPRVAISLTLPQLRVLAKSVSKTRDAELRKLDRLKAGSHVHDEVKRDFLLVDEVDAEISQAISDAVGAL